MNSTSNTPSAASKLQEQSQMKNVTDIEEGRMQTLNNISDLQNIEKGYFSKLNDSLMQNSLTPEEKDMLVQKINEISQMRVNLYKNLNGMYSFYHTNVASTRNTIEEQSVAIDIVEKELNEAKLRMKAVEEEKYNKLRLVEINNYYGQQYSEHTSIMKLIIMICVPVLLLTILLNRGILPRNLYTILIIVIVVVGVIYMWRYIISAVSRDNMNYQEYNWNFKPQDAPAIDTNVVPVNPWASKSNGTCSGQACCDDGYTYNSDPMVNKCVTTASLTQSTMTMNATPVATSTTTESLTNMGSIPGYIRGASENIFGVNYNFASY
jgi:hypothetical protein